MGFNFANPPPSSPLSPEERALIDAAVAEGKVRVIPRGVSGLEPLTPQQLDWKTGGSLAAQKSAETRRRAQRLRQAQVAHMSGQGMSSRAIAAALVLPLSTVQADLRAIKERRA